MRGETGRHGWAARCCNGSTLPDEAHLLRASRRHGDFIMMRFRAPCALSPRAGFWATRFLPSRRIAPAGALCRGTAAVKAVPLLRCLSVCRQYQQSVAMTGRCSFGLAGACHAMRAPTRVTVCTCDARRPSTQLTMVVCDGGVHARTTRSCQRTTSRFDRDSHGGQSRFGDHEGC